MVTANQAIAKARATASWAVGMCDNFVANMYGYSSSGYETAVKNWMGTPSGLRHPGDWNAPAGALMYWGGGRTGAGHVAISLGNGRIISTDATGPGVVAQIDARVPTDKWGHQYLGWATPYFQGREATNQLGQWSGSTTVTNASLGTDLIGISADAVTAGFIGALQGPMQSAIMTGVWLGETGLGVAAILFSVFMLARG